MMETSMGEPLDNGTANELLKRDIEFIETAK